MADTTNNTAAPPAADTGAGSSGAGTTVDTGASSTAGASGTPGSGSDGGSTSSQPWDVSAWDGKPESIHETYRPFYERVSKDYEERIKATSDELGQYKDLVAGIGDDPRVAQAERKASEFEAKIAEIQKAYDNDKLTHTQAQAKIDELQKAHDALLDTIAKQQADAFREKHKDIVADPVKREELLGLMDEGWDEEAAATLVGKSSKVRERAVQIVWEHRLTGSGHRLAVSQAMTELGQSEISSPGALLTNGANGKIAPMRTETRSVRNLSRDAARTEAARLALVPRSR